MRAAGGEEAGGERGRWLQTAVEGRAGRECTAATELSYAPGPLQERVEALPASPEPSALACDSVTRIVLKSDSQKRCPSPLSRLPLYLQFL